MNDETAMLYRSQQTKPSLHRGTNFNLTPSFPFMEFGLTSNASLEGILRTLSNREDFSKPTSLTRINNQRKQELHTDSYMQARHVGRMHNPIVISNLIRSLNGNEKYANDSSNSFFNSQSTHTDDTEKNKKISSWNNFIKLDSNINDYKLIRETPLSDNGISFPKRYGTLSNGDRDPNVFRAVSSKSNIQINSLKETFTPATGLKSDSKYLLKSLKPDDLINSLNNNFTNRNSVVKGVSTNLSDDNNNFNYRNMDPISVFENKESWEYNKRRLEEVNLNIESVPKLKVMSVDDIFKKSNNGDRFKPINPNYFINELGTVKETKETSFYRDKKEEKKSTENPEIVKESKNAVFNKKVENHIVTDESQSDSEKSQISDESDRASSPDSESHKSDSSMQSDSEDEDSKSSMIHQPIIPSTSPLKTLPNTLTENVESEGEDTFGSDEENSDNSKNKSDSGSESSVEINKSLSNKEKDDHESDQSISQESNKKSYSRQTSSSPNTVSNDLTKARIESIKSRIKSLKTGKKCESKSKPKSHFSQQDIMTMKIFQETELNMPIIFSKFPNVPPVINFVSEGQKIEQLPWQLRKLLRWRMSLLTPAIVKQTITRSGFRPSRLTTATDDLDSVETCDWILYFGKHMKGPIFKTLKDYQKVNHFPGSFQLGRKDRLWRNICKMQQDVGKKEFDFIPQTFCLPTDLEQFKECWENGGSKHNWIIKPPASARGIGIKVVSKWNQIPKRRAIVVQKYIANPYLINHSKFDLRLYVLLSCVDPLRIYLFDDGLVRFASIKYTNSAKTLHNRFIHLTNYSVNKLNVEYIDNHDNEACKGHKWSLKALWNYLRKRGVNTDHVWDRIKDLVVKTIISAEDMIHQSVKAYCSSSYNAKEIFGFDVLLDENLKPWILEVNVSPSLHSDTPLDVAVKGAMIKDTLNLCGYMIPELIDIDPPLTSFTKPVKDSNLPSSDMHIDLRFWLYKISENETAKAKYFESAVRNGQPTHQFDYNNTLPYQILERLTPADVRCLVDCYDEYERKGNYQRIYPVSSTVQAKKYLSFCEKIRYNNLLVATFITKFNKNDQDLRILEKLCQKKLHLLSAERGDKIDSKHIWQKPIYAGDA